MSLLTELLFFYLFTISTNGPGLRPCHQGFALTHPSPGYTAIARANNFSHQYLGVPLRFTPGCG